MGERNKMDTIKNTTESTENNAANENSNQQQTTEQIMNSIREAFQSAINFTDSMQKNDHDITAAKEFVASAGYEQTLRDINTSPMAIGQKATARSEADKRQTENLAIALDCITKYHKEMHNVRLDNIKTSLGVGLSVMALCVGFKYASQFIS